MMSKKGFTLMEIMIIVALLGIISAIVLPRFSGSNSNTKKKQEVELFQKACDYVVLTRGTITLYEHYDTFVNDNFLDGEYDGWAINIDEDSVFGAIVANEKDVFTENKRAFESGIDVKVEGVPTVNRKMLLILSAEDGILKARYSNESSSVDEICEQTVSINFNLKSVGYASLAIDKYSLNTTSVIY